MSAADVLERAAGKLGAAQQRGRGEAPSSPSADHQVAASSLAAPAAPICVVEQMGRTFAKLNAAITESELASVGEFAPFNDGTETILHHRAEALQHAAAHQLASSLEGAMFQVTIAAEFLSMIEPGYKEFRRGERKKAYVAAMSCLYSIIRVLERVTGADRGDLGGRSSMPDFVDPHTRVERALRGLHGPDPRRMDDVPGGTPCWMAPCTDATPDVDPLADLLDRHARTVEDLKARRGDPQALEALEATLDELHARQKEAPVPTTLAGVLAGLRWAVPEVEGVDDCGDGVLRAALAGLEEIVARGRADG
ncbi:hypothetical protein [Methylopila sp. Yamaguchi]|uniref:hypothetical protein n=1 Tax=Methylopila sp. Yamaguchi TaxID=1437817 RepID=UPI000CACDF0E|nr:hypothetical protein [Methylopila sp. Yamaguchi]GBD48149.1 hypothetical protein METY_1362 [Methylopila sp. Yamaguchi]